jgi:hypothetical protein
MSGVPSAEDRFHQNVLGLAELIYDIVCDVQEKGFPVVSPPILEFAIGILRGFSSKQVIETFICKANEASVQTTEEEDCFEDHPFVKIYHQDRDFFLSNTNILFSQLPPDRVRLFGEMFSGKDESGNPIVPEEDEEEVWEYFKSLVRIALKYIHQQRQPILIREAHQEIRKYQRPDVFSDIDLARHATLWELNLPFA